MFDLALISDALDGAAADAELGLTRRRVGSASGKIAAYKDTLREAKDARDARLILACEEFAKLRKAIEEAPRAVATQVLMWPASDTWATRLKPECALPRTWDNVRVLLVKCDK